MCAKYSQKQITNFAYRNILTVSIFSLILAVINHTLNKMSCTILNRFEYNMQIWYLFLYARKVMDPAFFSKHCLKHFVRHFSCESNDILICSKWTGNHYGECIFNISNSLDLTWCWLVHWIRSYYNFVASWSAICNGVLGGPWEC